MFYYKKKSYQKILIIKRNHEIPESSNNKKKAMFPLTNKPINLNISNAKPEGWHFLSIKYTFNSTNLRSQWYGVKNDAPFPYAILISIFIQFLLSLVVIDTHLACASDITTSNRDIAFGNTYVKEQFNYTIFGAPLGIKSALKMICFYIAQCVCVLDVFIFFHRNCLYVSYFGDSVGKVSVEYFSATNSKGFRYDKK